MIGAVSGYILGAHKELMSRLERALRMVGTDLGVLGGPPHSRGLPFSNLERLTLCPWS
jgi:hypothetical protein